MEKTVSIIIPAYNAEKHIERMLNSILNQTYNELLKLYNEVIINLK